MRMLLVNPWIVDLAAFNFWMRPLGLYSLAEWLWERGGDPVLVDCLSSFTAPGKFNRVFEPSLEPIDGIERSFARYGISEAEFLSRVSEVQPFDAVLVTSGMSYWHPGVRLTIEAVRKIAPRAPVALGGVYATLWTEHAKRHSGADAVFSGALQSFGGSLSRFLELPEKPIRSKQAWHALGLHDGASYGALRTALGCPFRCTYCASSRLFDGFEQRSSKEIVAELTAMTELGIRDVAFYDDALLVNFKNRLLPVLNDVESQGLPLNFHAPNGLHARLVDRETAEWLVRSRFNTLRLSLETVDESRQKTTGAKVANVEMAEAVGNLFKAGASRNSMGIYLLIGLPGQDLREVKAGVEFVKSLGVRPYLAEFSPIPGTPEWDGLVKSGTIPPDFDPLLTNNNIFFRRFSNYDPGEIENLRLLARS